MRGAVIYGAGDVRFEDIADPEIVAPTDAIVRTTATCVCGSDLWDYRGINPVPEPSRSVTNTAASSKPLAARSRRSSPASSSSDPSSLPTVPARTAATEFKRRVCTGY